MNCHTISMREENCNNNCHDGWKLQQSFYEGNKLSQYFSSEGLRGSALKHAPNPKSQPTTHNPEPRTHNPQSTQGYTATSRTISCARWGACSCSGRVMHCEFCCKCHCTLYFKCHIMHCISQQSSIKNRRGWWGVYA